MIQYLLLMILNLSLLSTNHPVSMIIIIILTTILYSISITSFIKTSWFSMILTLILVGAMLILFIYMASLSPNETFKMNKWPYLLIPTITLIKTSPTMEPPYMNITVDYLFNQMQSLITIMLISYLLLTMIIIVKITNYSEGPLRSS